MQAGLAAGEEGIGGRSGLLEPLPFFRRGPGVGVQEVRLVRWQMEQQKPRGRNASDCFTEDTELELQN